MTSDIRGRASASTERVCGFDSARGISGVTVNGRTYER